MAGLLFKTGDRTVILENLGVGIFGAYIGGDFVAGLFREGPAPKEAVFTTGGLGLAVLGALVSLVLLRLMRHLVGPMKPIKAKRRRD